MKKTHKHKHTTFGDLQVGDHFFYGGQEHVRIPIVQTGTYDTPAKRAPGDCVPSLVVLGYVNAVQVGSAQVSGFGPNVDVVKVRHEKRDYNGFFFE
jgi:hypothetical protein